MYQAKETRAPIRAAGGACGDFPSTQVPRLDVLDPRRLHISLHSLHVDIPNNICTVTHQITDNIMQSYGVLSELQWSPLYRTVHERNLLELPKIKKFFKKIPYNKFSWTFFFYFHLWSQSKDNFKRSLSKKMRISLDIIPKYSFLNRNKTKILLKVTTLPARNQTWGL